MYYSSTDQQNRPYVWQQVDFMRSICELSSLQQLPMTYLIAPGDTSWRRWTLSTLREVAACCLTGPNPYLHQCVDLSSKLFCRMRLRAMSELMNLVRNRRLEIILLKLLPHFPRHWVVSRLETILTRDKYCSRCHLILLAIRENLFGVQYLIYTCIHMIISRALMYYIYIYVDINIQSSQCKFIYNFCIRHSSNCCCHQWFWICLWIKPHSFKMMIEISHDPVFWYKHSEDADAITSLIDYSNKLKCQARQQHQRSSVF